MSKCLNPECLAQNLLQDIFCKKCGKKLLLKKRYRAFKIIGEDSFGRTFLAIDEHKSSNIFCVIKQILLPSQDEKTLPKVTKLLVQVARKLYELGKHPQIPALLAYFSEDNYQYLVQKFIDGENLGQELKSQGRFNEQKIRKLLVYILEVLKFVHENQIIHQQIKPQNIIRRAKDQRLFLVGFSISKVFKNIDLSINDAETTLEQYCAPEQFLGKPQYCSDLYSLGLTCIYLLTGIKPLNLDKAEDDNFLWRDCLGNNSVSDELGQILDKMIKTDCEKRYQSVEEVIYDLNLSHNINEQSSTFVDPKKTILQIVSEPRKTDIQATEKNFTEIIRVEQGLVGNKKEIRLEMLAIPAGQFIMGSSDYDEEKPIHYVKLEEFYLGKYPITQAQYQAIMGDNPSRFQNAEETKFYNRGWGDFPVERVTWYQAQEFCQKLSKQTGKKYQLPSESQWEYACRAGNSGKWCFGDDENQLKDYAWYKQNSRSQTHPVGQKKSNQWGLYDMHGNVWEWCADDYVHNYNFTPRNGLPHKTKKEQYKVMRGGAWYNFGNYCRCASRIDYNPCFNINGSGFRVVCLSVN